MGIATVNPATGETLRTYEAHGPEEVERRIAAAHEAYRQYRTTSFAERARLMRAAATLLDEDTEDIARTMTVEMGKPIAAARAEAGKCAKAMRWYAGNAEELLADEHPAESDVQDSGADVARVHYRPLGPILAVMPWNFPLWQVIRFAAPALMAGNTGLLKHASNVPRTALYLGDLFRRAGYPEGCFQALLIGSGDVEGVLRDPRVVAATLTGSEPAGRAVAAVAGDEVKKTVLELGGSDPYIVMPSADVVGAVKTAVTARVQNNGQSCIAAKRFIVHQDVYDDFSERFTAAMNALTVGDPRRVHRRRPPRHRTGQGRSGGTRRRRGTAGRHGPVRRPPSRVAGAAERLVLPAHRPHRHHAADADPSRGGLRTGRHGLSGHRHRGGRGRRQRLPVRAQLQRLDPLPGRTRLLRTGPGGRRRLRERHDRLPPGAALRRGQALGIRPRALRPRHPRVLQRDDGLAARLTDHPRPCAPDPDPSGQLPA